jgi:ubiquitin-associated SH3 domain-containing protein
MTSEFREFTSRPTPVKRLAVAFTNVNDDNQGHGNGELASGGLSDRRELILYATPTGPLADAVDRYFEEVAATAGATTAQTYPPHCTLTGFFRRTSDRADEVIAETAEVIGSLGPVPAGAVDVVGLTTTDDWVGLELRSPWLIEATAAVVAAHTVLPGDDALRPKDWLHLSLAYGVDDLAPHAELARRRVDPTSDHRWSIGLWERRPDGSWVDHR